MFYQHSFYKEFIFFFIGSTKNARKRYFYPTVRIRFWHTNVKEYVKDKYYIS